MTSDAKVGLLLGLVFIFVIAFLINGLPRFSTGSDKNNNELTTNIVSLHNGNLGVGSEKIEIINEATQPRQQAIYRPEATLPEQQEVPHVPLQQAEFVEPAPKQDNRLQSPPALPAPVVETQEPERPAITAPKRATFPRVYVVAEGDNLSEIAKKFYGAQEGNRIVNVNKIFQANRSVLKSADDIRAGQKIVVPPLQGDVQNTSKIKKFLGSRMFEPVKSIGKSKIIFKKPEPQRIRQYVVKEGESLWSIAEDHLGEGRRYTEIVKLNGDILKDEDFVTAGMRLKIPAR
jgi:nucleoid-associated protein YgaU